MGIWDNQIFVNPLELKAGNPKTALSRLGASQKGQLLGKVSPPIRERAAAHKQEVGAMSVKVEYYRTAQSDSLITAVWDETSKMWSVQMLLPEKVRTDIHLHLGQKASFKCVGLRHPKFNAYKGVQVGTSGQRQLFRQGGFHAEFWDVGWENGNFGGTLLIWGKHLGHLFGLLRKLLGERIDMASEVESNLRFDVLPVSFIRTPDRRSGKTIKERVGSICADGLLAWNIRLALYRMRRTGQPVGDQMSVDCCTGGYRYNFFNAGLGGCFSGETVVVIPRLDVLKRGSNRTYHIDSGAEFRNARINWDERASTLLVPTTIKGDMREVMVLGQILPQDLVFIVYQSVFGPYESDNEIKDICGSYGVECRVGERYQVHESLSREILPLEWRRI